jgi:hypothetical protein
VLAKLLLQLFVSVVDAKLLEAVDLECLKAVNVQDTDERVCFYSTFQASVYLCNNPIEQLRVHVLCQSISGKQSLFSLNFLDEESKAAKRESKLYEPGQVAKEC